MALTNPWLKAKYSFISALVFFVVSNPEMYAFTDTLFGSFVTVMTAGGAPTPAGLLVHTVLFFFAMWGLMLIPNL